MKDKKINALIDKLFSKSLNSQRKCFIEGCNNPAINSHLLQKNGIINRISENQHIRQVCYDRFPNINYKIKLVGVNQALSIKGFCAYHDTTLFKPIENQDVDFHIYENQLLFCFRALLKEYRDKELMIDFFNRFLNYDWEGFSIDKEKLKTMIIGNTWMMWDMEFEMKCILEDLELEQQSFNFVALSIPSIDICASATFSFSSLENNLKFEKGTYSKTEPMPAIILNLIPTDLDTKLIIGYNKINEKHLKHRFEGLEQLSKSDLLKRISDMLIRNFEMWACSNSFYQKFIKPREAELTHLLNFYTKENQFSDEHINFNLFDGYF